jgi:hypothetical protein
MSERTGRSSQTVAVIAGRYELLRERAASDDMLHWEAFDSALDRRVLLEFPREDVAHDRAAEERFWQQARASARTSTVAGGRVLDAGTDPETGRVFVVREWPQDLEQPTAAVRIPERVERHAPRRRLITPRLVTVAGLLALGLLVLFGLRAGAESWLAWVNAPLGEVRQQFSLGPVPTASAPDAQPARPAPTPAPPTATASTGSKPTAAPTMKATSTPVAGVARRIVNTDGRGVALRATPGGDRLPAKGYDEGAVVTAFEQSGEWTHIRGADGREGWVLSVTLGQP